METRTEGHGPEARQVWAPPVQQVAAIEERQQYEAAILDRDAALVKVKQLARDMETLAIGAQQALAETQEALGQAREELLQRVPSRIAIATQFLSGRLAAGDTACMLDRAQEQSIRWALGAAEALFREDHRRRVAADEAALREQNRVAEEEERHG